MGRNDRIRRAAAAHAPAARSDRGEKLQSAALGLDGRPGAAAYVVLRYYQPHHQCFSAWTADELRAFSGFNRKVSSMDWQLIFASGGKGGNKTGLGYTRIESAVLPRIDFLAELSEDISWCEMRVTQKARVFGFRAGPAFFLVFLDRNHELLPG